MHTSLLRPLLLQGQMLPARIVELGEGGPRRRPKQQLLQQAQLSKQQTRRHSVGVSKPPLRQWCRCWWCCWWCRWYAGGAVLLVVLVSKVRCMLVACCAPGIGDGRSRSSLNTCISDRTTDAATAGGHSFGTRHISLGGRDILKGSRHPPRKELPERYVKVLSQARGGSSD